MDYLLNFKFFPNINEYYLIFQETPNVDSLKLFPAVSARAVRILFHVNFHSCFLGFSDIPRVFRGKMKKVPQYKFREFSLMILNVRKHD